MSSFFNIKDLIRVLLKWKMHFGVIVIVSVLLSIIFSAPYFIKPKYKSFIILYPVNIVSYGIETPTEQTLQLFESGDIRDEIISRFDLMRHYEIDAVKEKYPYTKLNKKFEDNVWIHKTEYESIEITVYDRDPIVAMKIANAIVELFNLKARALQRDKTKELVKIARHELDKKKMEMDSMESALHNIRVKYGIIDYQRQSQSLTKEYYEALSISKTGKANALTELEKAFQNLKEKGGDFISLNEHLFRIRGTYNDLKVAYENVLKDVEKELTYTNIVTQAHPAEKKSYPLRWLIVLITSVSSLFFSVCVVLLIENWKQIKSI